MAPSIPSNAALRTAKKDAINEDLGIEKGADFWRSMDVLQSSIEGEQYMRDISYHKPSVMYWSQDQVWLHNKIQKSSGAPVSIDATSGVAQSLGGPVFLFNIVSHIDNIIVPLGQMATVKQNANWLTYWLNCWRSSGKKLFFLNLSRNDVDLVFS